MGIGVGKAWITEKAEIGWRSQRGLFEATTSEDMPGL